MSEQALLGLIAALITPYSSYGGIDTAGVGQLVAHALAGGVSGVLVNSAIGEGPHLSRGERLFVIEAAVAAAGGAPVYADTGAASSEETLALTRDAGQAGVRAAFVSLPRAYPLAQAPLRKHVREIARRGRMPIVVANAPRASSNCLTPASLAALAAAPGIVAVAEGDRDRLSETVRLADGRAPALFADDTSLDPPWPGGMQGVVSLLAGIVPGLMARFIAAMNVGDAALMSHYWARLQPLRDLLGDPATQVAACKAACALLGLPAGAPRRPVAAASLRLRAAIDAALQDLSPR